MMQRHWSMSAGRAGFGLLVLGVGLAASAVLASGPRGLAAELAAMQPRDHASLFGISRSEKVLVAGTIHPENTLLRAPFVAYTRERQVRDIRDDALWVPDGQETPPLLVEIPGGAIRVGAADYRLAGDLSTVVEGAYRYAGLGVGDQVLVLGFVAPGAGGGDFIATDVVRGTYAGYTRRQIDLPTVLVGAGLACVGAGIMAWLLRRGYSPFSPARAGR